MMIDDTYVKEQVYEFFFSENTFSLNGHSVYKFIGDETRDYLQRQITADVAKLENSGTLACRLDRNGRVFSFFYLVNIDQAFYIIVDSKIADETVNELEKFIIMEDITIKHTQLIAALSSRFSEGFVPISIFDNEGYIGFISEQLSITDFHNQLCVLTGWPQLDVTVERTNLINETRLNEFAISYNKGCFLGQETASKIESRRGAARYPVLLISKNPIEEETILKDKKVKVLNFVKSDDFYLSVVRVPRDLLINGLEIEYDGGTVRILTYPIIKEDKLEISEHYFNKAVKRFHQGEVNEAIMLLDQVISFNPHYADAYESKGVILGNNGDHQKAIDVMDELLKVDENSVMAHTNKSLYLMKLGKIEEAEEEKSLATVASFKRFGDEAKFKKEQEERERAEKEDRARRFDMFNKVLAIDENDVVANYGLADIHFSNDKYDKAMEHIEVVLKENPKYSVAYLLKSKLLFKQKKYEECLSVIEEGMPIATSQGELMPANEMQALKSKISKL